MRVCCTGWHACAVALLTLLWASPGLAQEADEDPAVSAADPAPEPEPAPTPGPLADAATALAAPVPEPPAPAVEDEFSDIDDELPPEPEPAPPVVARAAPGAPVQPAPEEERPRYWRYPRNRTERPLTLAQGIMYWRSTVGVSIVPAGTTNQLRSGTYWDYAVGIMDDFEAGVALPGLIFAPPFSLDDPSVHLRVRLLSGDVQIALRGEWAFPLQSNDGVWMGYGLELAWNPVSWFRFETHLDYGLTFLDPLQQTIHIPLRVRLQAGPNTFGVETGGIMYNDADDFDVPLIFSYFWSSGGYSTPRTDLGFEGGIGDLMNAENSWYFRASATIFAAP